MSFEMLQKTSPAQAEIAALAARDGRYRAPHDRANRTCRNLNGRGLLRRDPKDGALWYPTEVLLEMIGAMGSPAAPEPEPEPVPLPPAVIEADAQASELAVIVERARALFDEGDVQAAMKLSSVAYDQAKAAAASAERVKASRALVEKARRMQADALKIETMCTIALADAVDEAQAKGQISSKGRPQENVQGADIFTLDDVGVDRRRLSEARKIRNAAKAEPGFIDQVIEARLSSGLEPSRAAIRQAAGHAIGTKTATREERGDDLYETPAEAMRVLLALERFLPEVWEPSVGKGAILRPLEAAGYEVSISDLVDRNIATRHGELQLVSDFLKLAGPPGDGPLIDIVTNPPFGIANAYAAHALKNCRPGKMALLLNLNFLAGFEDPDRRFVMDQNPPSRIYVFTRRLPMMHRDGWQGKEASSQMNCAWFVWERNWDGSYGEGYPQLIRVDWKAFQQVEPMTPGAFGARNLPPPVHAPPDEEEDCERQTPRKSVEERVKEDRAAALAWMAKQDVIYTASLRQGLGIRSSTAEALIAHFVDEDLIALWSGDGYIMTPRGIDAAGASMKEAV